MTSKARVLDQADERNRKEKLTYQEIEVWVVNNPQDGSTLIDQAQRNATIRKTMNEICGTVW